MAIRCVKIKDICAINLDTIKSGDTKSVIRYLDTSNIIKNKILGTQRLDSSIEPFPSRAKRKVRLNTIIYSTVRPDQEHHGIIDSNNEDIIVSTGFVTLDVIDDEVDPVFLYYLITKKETTEYLHRVANNNVSSYPSINPGDLGELVVRIPNDLLVQQKIAAVLTALDAKIELNQRINAQLEGLAKTLYDYWFVQFDFPDEQGRPYRSAGGKMVWNEALRREIPAGWEVDYLEKFGSLKNGINYSADDIGDREVKIINVRNISNSNMFVSQFDLDKIRLSGSEVAKYLVSDRDILIARSGVPGATRLIYEYEENTIFCGFIIRYKVLHTIFRNYMFFTLKQMENSSTNRAAGTIMQNISQEILKGIIVPMPDRSVLRHFDDHISPIFQAINLKDRETFTLLSIRDWLLPMLMNGQVRVG